MAPVRSVAIEGAWQEAAIMPDLDLVPIVVTGRFSPEVQYAVQIMDARRPALTVEAEYIVCVPKDEIGRDVRPGDVLHVVRRRGRLRQILVRRLGLSSDNARVLEALAPNGEPIPVSEVEIHGVMVGKYTTYRI